jgi:hypothetical protein
VVVRVRRSRTFVLGFSHDHTAFAGSTQKILQGVMRMAERILVGLVVVAIVTRDLDPAVVVPTGETFA